MEPERIWVKSKWEPDDLDKQPVEFRLPIEKGFVEGVGRFIVAQNPEGLLSVQIEVDRQGKDSAERIVTYYYLPQEAVDKIVHHPDQDVAEYLLS
jgi:hypothetical protein